jgi:hypothetical protein
MSIPGLVFALLLALFVLAWIVMPLFSREPKQAVGGDDLLLEKQRERLLAYYERILRNIRDLDEDHALEKIAEDEYTRERAEWAARGVQVLQALDSINQREAEATPATPADDGAADQAIDDVIETAVRRYRQQRKPE